MRPDDDRGRVDDLRLRLVGRGLDVARVLRAVGHFLCEGPRGTERVRDRDVVRRIEKELDRATIGAVDLQVIRGGHCRFQSTGYASSGLGKSITTSTAIENTTQHHRNTSAGI